MTKALCRIAAIMVVLIILTILYGLGKISELYTGTELTVNDLICVLTVLNTYMIIFHLARFHYPEGPKNERG